MDDIDFGIVYLLGAKFRSIQPKRKAMNDPRAPITERPQTSRDKALESLAAPPPRWEDEYHGTNDAAELRAMFRERLYANPPQPKG